MLKNIKAISGVVAMALLLVVSVVAVINFDTFYSTFQSKINIQVEEGSNLNNINLEGLVGNKLYIKNSNSDNISINQIKIGETICDINSSNYTNGVHEIDINGCLDNATSSIQDVVIFSDDSIITKKFFVKDLGGTAQCNDPNLIANNVKSGVTIFGVVGDFEGNLNLTDGDGDSYLWVGVSNYNNGHIVDCDDSNSSITFAVDGTCDNDGDGFIDSSAGGNDINDDIFGSNISMISGLVGEYLFENGGNLGEDTSGNSNDGTPNGGLSQIVGILGNSTYFSGSNDYIELPTVVSGLDSVSISMWVNLSSLSGDRSFFGNFVDPNNNLLLYYDDPLGLRFIVRDNLNNSYDSFYNNISLDTWYHLVAIYTRNEIELYINNVLVSNYIFDAGPIKTITGNQYIGVDGDLSRDFLGSIDNLRVYNRSLSLSEIKGLYNE